MFSFLPLKVLMITLRSSASDISTLWLTMVVAWADPTNACGSELLKVWI